MIKIHRFNIKEGNICCCVFLNQSLDSGVLAKQRYIKMDLLSYFFTSHTEKKETEKKQKTSYMWQILSHCSGNFLD